MRPHLPDDPWRRWTLAAIGLAGSVGGGTLLGSVTVSAMDPFYSAGPPPRVLPAPAIERDDLPAPAFTPVQAPGFALPADMGPYDDPALLAGGRARAPEWNDPLPSPEPAPAPVVHRPAPSAPTIELPPAEPDDAGPAHELPPPEPITA